MFGRRSQRRPYASRGGIKLAHALSVFHVSVSDRICLDIGAGEGGFTDVLLQNGARYVFAVDVGYGKLAWKLRSDNRVKAMDRWNVRYMTAEHLYGSSGDRANIAVVDLSFISVTKVLKTIWELLVTPREILILVKPQFEARRKEVRKGGKIFDPAIQSRVIEEIAAAMSTLGWEIQGICDSSIRGRTGNLEFFVHGRDDMGGKVGDVAKMACDVVEEAHRKWNS